MSASALFHPLKVRAIEPDTEEAVIVAFDVPPDLRSVFAFNQGQYLTLRTEVDGEDLRRSYSICTGIDDGELRVGVRKVAGGRFSNWINQRLKPGDALQVMPPQGRFFVPLDPASQRHYLGVAGGSGITPILSIMKTVLGREPRARFTLIYANRAPKSTMFKEEIEDLKNRYMARLSLHHVFSGDASESDDPPPPGGAAGLGAAQRSGRPLHVGMMDRAKLGEFLGRLVDPKAIDHAFVCGPYQMNDEAEAALLDSGVPEERIHIERFGVAPSVAGSSQAGGAVEHEVKPGDAERARITIIRDGLKREFDFSKDDPSILDAASSAGLEVPFSCTSGVCGTCRAKLVEGQVRMTRNFALDKADLGAGFVLTCQSHPLTERVVLSFDDR